MLWKWIAIGVFFSFLCSIIGAAVAASKDREIAARLLLPRGCRRTRFVAGLLLLLYLPACHMWRVENVPPAQLISSKHPDKVRVRLADSSSVDVQQPSIARDSLRGYDKQGARAVALSDVHSIATRHANWFANGFFIALGATFIGLAIGVAATGVGGL